MTGPHPGKRAPAGGSTRSQRRLRGERQQARAPRPRVHLAWKRPPTHQPLRRAPEGRMCHFQRRWRPGMPPATGSAPAVAASPLARHHRMLKAPVGGMRRSLRCSRPQRPLATPPLVACLAQKRPVRQHQLQMVPVGEMRCSLHCLWPETPLATPPPEERFAESRPARQQQLPMAPAGRMPHFLRHLQHERPLATTQVPRALQVRKRPTTG